MLLAQLPYFRFQLPDGPSRQHLTSCDSLGEASCTGSLVADCLQLPAVDPQTIDLVEQVGLITEEHLPSLPQVLSVQESPSSHDALSVHGVTGVELQFCSLSKLHPVPNDTNH